ncbi:MAG: alpha-glucosidase C-terminal domain-containing protein, partial [Candidatus Ornithomonoglobus sp.]
NKYCIFERKTDNQRILVAINADENPAVCHFDAGCGLAVDLLSGEPHDFGGGSELPPYSVQYWEMEK